MKNLKEQPDVKLLLQMIDCIQNLIKIIEENILYSIKPDSIIHKNVYLIEIYEAFWFLVESVVHHVRAVIYIAKGSINSENPSLVNSALVITRVVLETSAKIYWLSESSDDTSELLTNYKKLLNNDKENFTKYDEKYNGFEESQKKEIEKNKNISDQKIIELDKVIESTKDPRKKHKLAPKTRFPPDATELIKGFDTFLNKKYSNEHNDILLYYRSISKIIHGMNPVIYTLENESKKPASDWDTVFRICFAMLMECSEILFSMLSVSSDDFHAKLHPIKSNFSTASEKIEKL
jgi:hypothetical protein